MCRTWGKRSAVGSLHLTSMDDAGETPGRATGEQE